MQVTQEYFLSLLQQWRDISFLASVAIVDARSTWRLASPISMATAASPFAASAASSTRLATTTTTTSPCPGVWRLLPSGHHHHHPHHEMMMTRSSMMREVKLIQKVEPKWVTKETDAMQLNATSFLSGWFEGSFQTYPDVQTYPVFSSFILLFSVFRFSIFPVFILALLL